MGIDGRLNSEQDVGRRALKAGAFYVATQIFVRGITFLVTPVYTRLVTQEQYGQIRVYEAWLLIFVTLMSLGLYRGVERARYDFPDRFDEYISSTQTLSYIGIAAYFAVFLIFYKPVCRFLGLDAVLFALMFLYVFTYTGTLFFQYGEKQKMEYRRMMIFSVTTMIPAVLLSIAMLIWGNRTGREASLVDLRNLGYFVPQIIGGFVVIVWMYRQGRTGFDRRYWKYGLLYSLPLVPNQLSLQIMNQSDKIMVQKMTGDANAGVFALATTVSFILWVLLEASWDAWLPWLFTKITEGDRESVKRPWLAFVGIFAAVAIAMILVAPELSLILGGKGYDEAAYLVAPMVTGVLYRFYSNIYSAMQNYHKKTQFVAAGTVAVMMLNVVLNYIGITKLGYGAAAYTTAISYFVLLVVQGVLEKRVTGERLIPMKSMVGRSLAIAALGELATLSFGLHWAVRWAAAVCIAAAAMTMIVKQGIISLPRNGKR